MAGVDPNQVTPKLVKRTFTVANGATTSDTLDLGGMTVVGLRTPSALTSTNMTFKAGVDQTDTVQTLKYSNGTNITFNLANAIQVPCDPSDFASVRYLQLVMGSSEGGARSIDIVVREVQ